MEVGAIFANKAVGITFIPNIQRSLPGRLAIARGMSVQRFSANHFRIIKGTEEFIVDLGLSTCSCLWFNDHQMPCWHATAAIDKFMVPPAVEPYISTLYKVNTILDLYQKTFRPVMLGEIIANDTLPPSFTRQRGRPPTARLLGIQDIVSRVPHCGHCKQAGHYRPRCPRLAQQQPQN